MAQAGGRTSILQEQGFRFDRGPTFFLYPRVLQEIFAAIGRDLAVEVPMKRLDPAYRLIFDRQGVLDVSSDPERMARELARFSPADAARLPEFLEENRRKLDGFSPIIDNEFSSWTRLFSQQMLRLLPLARPWRSLDSDLKLFFKDPRIRLAFSFQSKFLGMSPYRCPSLFSILSYLDQEHGVYHPIGGCGRVSERMQEIAQEMGVRFCFGEEVQEILFARKRAVGLVTDHKRHTFDALVVNADFAQAMRRLVPEDVRPRLSDKKLASRKYSPSAFMLYLGVEGEVAAPHHSYYFSFDERDKVAELTPALELPSDPSLYLANPCVSDPSMARAGMSSLYVMVPVPHLSERINWTQEAMHFREVVYGQLAKMGLEGIRERVVFEKIFTPQDWQDQMEVYQGAIYSAAHTPTQILHMRPGNRFRELDGVYLVGGGTHPGSGLPFIYSSARISSRLICQDLDEG